MASKIAMIAGLLAATTSVAYANPPIKMLPLPNRDLQFETMSPATLRALHLPADAAKNKKLLQMLQNPRAHQVTKTLGPLKGVKMGPPLDLQQVDSNQFTSSNWSGSFVVLNDSWASPIIVCNVPYVITKDGGPVDLNGNDTYWSCWSARGGISSLPMWQSGIVGDTNGDIIGQPGNGPTTVTFMECYPDAPVGIFLSFPGDQILATQWIDPDTGNGITLIQSNITGETFYGSAPGCNASETAEWIVEAPNVNGEIAQLSYFGALSINGDGDSNNPSVNPGDPSANFIDMIQNGSVVSQCAPQDENDFTCTGYPYYH
jgi:hypothetical protein